MSNQVAAKFVALALMQEYFRKFEGEEEGWSNTTLHHISLVVLRWIQNIEDYSISLHNMCIDLSDSIPEDGHEVADALRDTMLDIEHPEDLFSFFETIQAIVQSHESENANFVSSMAPHSVWGLFCRRMLLNFNKMSFSQVSKYLARIQAFCKQSSRASAYRASMDAGKWWSTYQTSAKSGRKAPWKEAEKHIFQPTRSYAGFDLPGFRDKAKVLLEDLSDDPLSHYIRHLGAIHCGDYSTALENLHRFFDVQGPRAISSPQAAKDREHNVHYHYSLLSLASLHHRFGHIDEALSAIHESVRIAQEHSDPTCLNHALGWLTRLSRGTAASELATLFRAATKEDESTEGKYLHALAGFRLAQDYFCRGYSPTRVLNLVESSLCSSMRESQEELTGMGFLLRTGLFDMYGHSGLSMLYPQLLLHNYNAGIEERCEAYCKIAMYYFAQGERHITKRVLKAAMEEFPPFTPYSKLWMATKCQLEHQEALFSESWETAAAVGEELNGLLSTIPDSDLDAQYREALFWQEKEVYDKAVVILKNSLESIKTRNRTVESGLRQIKLIRLQLMEAEIHHQTGNHFMALQIILKCIAKSNHYHVAVLRAHSLVLLADIQLAISMNEQAEKAINEALPTILAHGSCETRGLARLVYGKSLVACGSQHKAIRSFEAARIQFAKVGAKKLERQALYCMGLLYNQENDIVNRDKCAQQFCDLLPSNNTKQTS
eukprot:m.60958 g.60958  ORF g.60958 m.60958 type:complete len:718 (-) comp11367_c0_seq1:25-2178(-)